MRLTRRGWTVVATVLAAIASGSLFGSRSLDAIAVPGVVVLAAAAIQVRRAEPPRIGRDLPSALNRGDVVDVPLRFDLDSTYSARVLDHLDFGLAGDGNDVETTISSGALHYDLRCVERGHHRVGPTRVEVRDVLGLLSRSFLAENAASLIVRPAVFPLAGRRRRELLAITGGNRPARQAFEHLREYERGDALRDVHWKTSAKQPDDELIVKEFTADDERRSVLVAAEAASGEADGMADAAASVLVDLLEEGFEVGLATARKTLEPDGGRDHREELLDHLATVGDGQLPSIDRNDADVLVTASRNGVTVSADGHPIPFEELAVTTVPGKHHSADGRTAPSPR